MRFIGLFFLVILVLGSCKNDHNHSPDHKHSPDHQMDQTNIQIDDETQQMVDTLEYLYSRVNWNNHPHENHEAIKVFDRLIAEGKVDKNAQALMNYALMHLKAGNNDKAIGLFNEVINVLPYLQTINPKSKDLYAFIAIANMRKGEIENCVANHNAESCHFPIKGKGIHILPEGSTKAIDIYKQILAVDPKDYESQWLLNIAYMTLGQYPDQVPKQFLISPEKIENEIKLKPFYNAAMDLGLDVNELSGSSILEDMDGDGDLDLLASSWNLKGQLRYYKNDHGKFREHTKQAGIEGIFGGLNLKQADFDNDGDIDVFVPRGAWKHNTYLGIYPCSLLRNNGDNTFTDVTISSGMYTIKASQSVVWVDINNDGWLDLFIASETTPQNRAQRFPCGLYINNQDGTFEDKSAEYLLNLEGFFKGVAAADYDNDGDQDLYLTSLIGDNLMIKNLLNENGSLSFKVVSIETKTKAPTQAFPCWFFDYDNDGWEDLYVAAYGDFFSSAQTAEVAKSYLGIPTKKETSKLYHNNQDGTFSDLSTAANLNLPLHTMGCNYGDINNDGFLDFYLGTGAPSYKVIVPNRLFLNQNGEQFADVTTSANVGNIQKGHGISMGDIDQDGDIDIYAVMGGAFSGDFFQNAMYINPGNEYNWTYIKLVGTQSNRDAIGAKVKLTVNDDGNIKHIYRTVSTGASFGANSIILEIGIGTADTIENIEIRWPNGSTEFLSYGPIPIKKRITITEGVTNPTINNIKKLTLSGDNNGGHHHHH